MNFGILRTSVRHLWQLLGARYITLFSLCWAGVLGQIQYRVPGDALFIMLTWTGIGLSLVLIILFIPQFLFGLAAHDRFRHTLRRTERVVSWSILAFVGYSAIIVGNGWLDRSSPREERTQVVDMDHRVVGIGNMRMRLAWVELSPWNGVNGTKRVVVSHKEQARLWGGQPVLIHLRDGAFGINWVEQVERDDEHYFLGIISTLPSASTAWKELTRFYLVHHRTEEATRTARAYLELAPTEFDFSCSTVAGLAQHGKMQEAMELLEPYAMKSPTYERLNVLGWIYHELGNNKGAAELVEASIPLDPNNWPAYFHLGYIYKSMNRAKEAITMFEKVKQYRPNFPEMDENIRSLRQVRTTQS